MGGTLVATVLMDSGYAAPKLVVDGMAGRSSHVATDLSNLIHHPLEGPEKVIDFITDIF